MAAHFSRWSDVIALRLFLFRVDPQTQPCNVHVYLLNLTDVDQVRSQPIAIQVSADCCVFFLTHTDSGTKNTHYFAWQQ